MKKNKYSQHNIKTITCIVGGFFVLCILVVVLSGNGYKQYLGLEEYPNCMNVEEFGEQGNEEGCIRHTTTLTPDYQEVYSLSFESFYMNSHAAATKKYESLLDSMKDKAVQDEKETQISDQSQVTFYKTADENVWFIVRDGQTLYKAYGINQQRDKKQKWFDVLRIKYQVPNLG